MRHLLYIILIFKSIISFSFGDTPKYDWPHEVSDLEPDSRIVFGKLDNGFRYVFMPNHHPPKHFAIRLYVNAGSLMEEEEERGLAHFLEHMAFKGIRGYPEDKMIQTLQDLGVPFGSHNNAHTDFRETVYKLDFMDNSPEKLEHGLKIMAGIADGMFLGETLIQKEIGVILAEKRDSDGTRSKFGIDYLQFASKGLRINDRLPIGLESVIKSANPILLRNFYKKWYRPERMVLVIAGDLDRNQVESHIKDNFSTFSDLSNAPEEPTLGVLKYKQGIRSRVYWDKELPKTTIKLFSLKTYEPKLVDKKTKKNGIYRNIAYRIFIERLRKLEEHQDCPFTSAEASATLNFEMFEQSTISMDCKPEQVIEALTTAENQLRKIFEYGFTTEEFNRVKRAMLYEYKSDKDRDETHETSFIIQILLDTVINKNIFTTYLSDYERAKEFLENEANEEECLKIFKDTWDMENLSIYLSTNSDIKYTEAQLNEAYYRSKKIVSAAPEEREEVKYRFDKLDEKGAIVDEYYNEDLDCYQYRLSNNLRLNLKQTNFDKNTILYQINFGNGEDEAKTGPDGITAIAKDIMYNGGIGELSKEELIRAFDGSGITIPVIAVGADGFTISSSINPDDFEQQMNLICGLFMEPAYRSDRLNQMRLSIRDYYNHLNQTVNGMIALEVDPYLTNGHPDYGLWNQADLVARTPEEVKNWMADALSKSYMEISIVGDFNKEEILESVLKTVGALPNRRDNKQCYKEKLEVSLQDAPVKMVFSYYSALPLATSIIYWELPDWESDNEFYIDNIRATVITEILNERLRQKVRMELGEGYSPYAIVSFGGKAITASTQTDPEKANYLCELIVEIAEQMSNEGSTEDEFNRVILSKLLNIESNKYSNSNWLNRLAYSQEYPYLNKYTDFINDYYKTLTLEEVNQAAKEYLQARKALKIMIVPDSHLEKVEMMLKDKY